MNDGPAATLCHIAPVTISVGVGTLVPRASDTAVQRIEEVDRRLYRAKQNGRNALVCAG